LPDTTSESNTTACVVSHDAGGAEILACYVTQNGIDCRLVLDGPAAGVFKRRLGMVKQYSLEEALASCAWFLTGSSWQSDLEWRAIGEARRAGKRTVTFLDHWVNYPERFIRNGVQHLPDEIWVGDEDSFAMAVKHFPGTPTRIVPNPYFVQMRHEIAEYEATMPNRAAASGNALFVSENLSGLARLGFADSDRPAYTEFDAFEYLLGRIPHIGLQIQRVILRPHPSDPPGKYSALIAKHAPVVQLGGGRPLVAEIVDSDVVAGCETTALIVAVLAGKKVLCAVPPGHAVRFIHRRPGIEMLRNLPVRPEPLSIPAAESNGRSGADVIRKPALD
jgi:hypothetical protein